MDADKISVVQECVTNSLAGKLTFPEVVHKLTAIGVERYHADYTRRESTYYLSDGQSHVLPLPHPEQLIAATFDASGVEAAIRASQRGEISYVEFLKWTMAAGCVGYFVQITGRRALYFGRNGDVHLEPFPVASKP